MSAHPSGADEPGFSLDHGRDRSRGRPGLVRRLVSVLVALLGLAAALGGALLLATHQFSRETAVVLFPGEEPPYDVRWALIGGLVLLLARADDLLAALDATGVMVVRDDPTPTWSDGLELLVTRGGSGLAMLAVGLLGTGVGAGLAHRSRSRPE